MIADRGCVQRLFFALWPPCEIASQIAARAEALGVAGKRVPPERIHLTLAFHGRCDRLEVHALQDRAALLHAPAFTIELDRIGYFRRAATTWLGCARIPAALSSLAQQLQLPQPGEFLFVPHVSIARKSPPHRLQPVSSIVWPVDAFSLVTSGEGARPGVYRTVARWCLHRRTSR